MKCNDSYKCFPKHPKLSEENTKKLLYLLHLCATIFALRILHFQA